MSPSRSTGTPAPSEPLELLRLPHTWRPMGGPVVAGLVGTAVTISMFGMWFLLPGEVREQITVYQTATLLLFLLVLLAGLFGVGRTRLSADDAGLTVVNFYRVHRLEWAQVVGVTFRRGDPWAVFDLDDGTTVSVMALQSADGRRGREAAAAVAALIAARTRTATDD